MERRVIKAGHNNNRMMEPGKVKNPTAQDPRFDAEARKKKIEALKVCNIYVFYYPPSLHTVVHWTIRNWKISFIV